MMDDSFTQKMMDVMNNSALALMISVGHRTKLFDVMAESPQLSSIEIAKKARLPQELGISFLNVENNLQKGFRIGLSYILKRMN